MKADGLARRTALLGAGALLASACSGPLHDDVLDVRSFGDVLTDGSGALRRGLAAASTEGAVLEVPAGVTVRMKSPVVVPGGVRLRGAGSLVGVAQRSRLLTLSGEGIEVSGLRLRSAGPALGTFIVVADGARDVRIDGVSVRGATTGVTLASGSRDVHISDGGFREVSCGVSLRGDVQQVRITASRFQSWSDRAVWVVGVSSASPKDVEISGCVIDPPRPNGKVRQPIQVNGHDDRPLERVKVVGNRVRGPGTSYHDRHHAGSADLISLHRCTDFTVRGNVVLDGGDVGITVSQQSHDGVVEDNICRRNDSVGICIGSRSSRRVSDISVRNNTCEDNGQDRLSDGRDWALSGVLVANGQRITVTDNTFRDTGGGTQRNAVSVLGSDIEVSGNFMTSPKENILADQSSTVTSR